MLVRRFQLILFDLIGKASQGAKILRVSEGFQLILFDLIGKATDTRPPRGRFNVSN